MRVLFVWDLQGREVTFSLKYDWMQTSEIIFVNLSLVNLRGCLHEPDMNPAMRLFRL